MRNFLRNNLVKTGFIVFVLTLISVNKTVGQTGTEFWFASPDISYQHANNSVPIYLHVTALYSTHVTISRPADPTFTPVEFDLSPQQTQSVRVDSDFGGGLLPIDEIETYARDEAAVNFIQNKGFLIQASPGEVTAYVEYTGSDVSGNLNNNNCDIAALKANNALGKEFWVSTQRKYMNHAYADAYSGFVVVATQDNTTVTVDPNGNNLQYIGTTPFTVTLQKGQTFAVRAAGQVAAQHIFGIKVTSTKDIAITLFDDSMQIDDGGGNWDLFADQTIPDNLVGEDYIVMKGNVQDIPADSADGEAIFITPTVNNTNIYINDTLVASNLSAGSYFSYVIKDQATYVHATQPVYVNHITGYSTSLSGSRELGGAVLPPIDGCTGSYSVTVKRSPSPGFVFFNNLFVRNDTVTGSPTRNQAINHFTYSINGGTPVAMNPGYFTYIMDSAFAYYDKTKAGAAAYYNNTVDGDILQVDNDIAKFQLGVMQGKQSPGCKYGYFSDYAQNAPSVGIGGYTQGQTATFCNLDPIHLVASGGTSYKWYAPFDSGLVSQLDYDTVEAPYFTPDTAGTYYFNVVITGECFTKDTLQTELIVMTQPQPDFTLSADAGCTPFDPLITNNTNSAIAYSQIWTITPANSSSYQINQDTIPNSFVLNLPDNLSDTIQKHRITLAVKGIANSCPASLTDTVSVLPVTFGASFTMKDTLECAGDDLGIVNTTGGDHDSLTFLWNFDDSTQSALETPAKTVINTTDSPIDYKVRLNASGTNVCSDTFSKSVTVMPQITQARFTLSDTNLCSGKNVTLTNQTAQAFHYRWYLDDTTLIAEVSGSGNSTYFFPENSSDSIISKKITLKAYSSDYYCETDTSSHILMYPVIRANFTLSDTSMCSGKNVTVTDKTSGAVNYSWYMDDTTLISQNSAPEWNYSLPVNDSNSVINKTITLKAFSSDYVCEGDTSLDIHIYPLIHAKFTMRDTVDCKNSDPLITNTSSGGTGSQVILWDFDDGSYSSDYQPAKVFVNKSDTVQDLVVSLKISDTYCTDSFSSGIVVMPEMNTVPLIDVVAQCTPAVFRLSANGSSNVDSVSWHVSSNNFSGEYNTTPDKLVDIRIDSLNFASAIYTVYCLSTNRRGCMDSVKLEDVTLYHSPVVQFTSDPNPANSGENIAFNNQTQYADSYYWDFGNGWMSSQDSPVVSYEVNDTSMFPVTLIAQNGNCSDTAVQEVTVYPVSVESSVGDAEQGTCNIYQSDRDLVIQWNKPATTIRLTILDMSGRLLVNRTYTLQTGRNRIPETGLKPDIYLVSIMDNTARYAIRIRIQ